MRGRTHPGVDLVPAKGRVQGQGCSIGQNQSPPRQTTGDNVEGYHAPPQQKPMMHLCDFPPTCGCSKSVEGGGA